MIDPAVIAARYARAATRAGPNFAARHPQLSVDGYWVDEVHFFFVDERWDPAEGRLLRMPTRVDVRTGAHKALPLGAIEALVAQAAGGDSAGLCSELNTAQFDMPDVNTLVIGLGDARYTIMLDPLTLQERESAPTADGLRAPDGEAEMRLEAHDLWLRQRGAADLRVTQDGMAHYGYGEPAESSLAPLAAREAPTLLGLWSSDSRWFLTHLIDERHLLETALIDSSSAEGPNLHQFRYARAGDPLPEAVPVAVERATGRVICFEDARMLVSPFSPFRTRSLWFGGENEAWCLRRDRRFRNAELLRLDLSRGTAKIVLREQADHYIDHHPLFTATPMVRTLAGSGEIIYYSERDGWGHLYLYDGSGVLVRRLTEGPCNVRDIVDVDEAQRSLLFLSSTTQVGADPARCRLCRVPLDGGPVETLYAGDGDMFAPRTESPEAARDQAPVDGRAGVSPGGGYAVLRETHAVLGDRTSIVNLESATQNTLSQLAPGPGDTKRREVEVVAADGETRLHGLLYLPHDFDEAAHYPLVDFIYPGPQATHRPQAYGAYRSAFAQALAELGFACLMLDTRGMPLRNRAFHHEGAGRLLEPQLADHAAAVRQLCASFNFLDADRVAIVGESAGGAAAFRALCDYGDIYQAGVAACGTHDPLRYASFWTDKYGATDAESIAANDNIAAASRLSRPLFLLHGERDDNVLVHQTLSLVDALVAANRAFDLLIVPGAGHDLLQTHGYAMRRVWDFLVRQLHQVAPPAFDLRFPPEAVARYRAGLQREMRQ